MHKIVIHRPGGYEQLKYEEHSDPSPGAGEVLVETTAIGVNYVDCCVRFGVYSSAKKYVGWPITPGFEFAGVVKQIGSGVANLAVGQEVFGLVRFGAYATHVVAPANALFPLPHGFSSQQAGGFPTVFITAYHALFQCANLSGVGFQPAIEASLPGQAGSLPHFQHARPKPTVLIHSAAGGVGSALVQLARIAQCRTIGIVGSSHKVDYVKSLGCDVVIDKSRENLWSAVEAAAPGGCDVVCDANGPATLAESYRHLRPTGRLIVYGFHTMLPRSNGRHSAGQLSGGRLSWLRGAWGLWKLPRFNPLTMVSDNKGVLAFNLSFLFDRHDLLGDAMNQLLRWADDGRLQPPPLKTYPLADVAQAHQAIESGQTVGKLVLIP